MSLHVMTIVGTRPELIKLSRIMVSLEKHFKHTLVHTGQNYDYELNEVFFTDLDIKKPDYFLDAAKDGSASQTIANVISEVDKVLEKEKPDAILLYGDTNSCLSVIPAKRRQIPIFHMEAGNRCFDQRVPEELNRKIVDHMSDINMVHCEHSRRYLINEGLRPEQIIKTGSPMNEVLSFYQERTDASDILERLNLKPKEFFVLSIHREENVDYDHFKELLETLNVIADKYKKPLIVSTHPRTKKRIDEQTDYIKHDLISFMKPMGFHDYVKLQKESYCVISDSGTITEESSLLKFPAIMIRKAHERPEGMDVGSVIMSGLSAERVVSSIEIAVDENASHRFIKDYDNEKVSIQVVKIIQSYVDYINRTVWRKENV